MHRFRNGNLIQGDAVRLRIASLSTYSAAIARAHGVGKNGISLVDIGIRAIWHDLEILGLGGSRARPTFCKFLDHLVEPVLVPVPSIGDRDAVALSGITRIQLFRKQSVVMHHK